MLSILPLALCLLEQNISAPQNSLVLAQGSALKFSKLAQQLPGAAADPGESGRPVTLPGHRAPRQNPSQTTCSDENSAHGNYTEAETCSSDRIVGGFLLVIEGFLCFAFFY